MPIYEYRCDRGHTFEVTQRMAEDPLESCATCDAPVQRVFHPVAVHFKGSGFYTTDYKKKSAAKGSDGAKKEPSAPSPQSDKTDGKADSKAKSKPEG